MHFGMIRYKRRTAESAERHSRNQPKKKSLDHELRELYELHEYNPLSVIPAKAGIHFRAMSYPNTFKEITTEIQKTNSEQCSATTKEEKVTGTSDNRQ
jgi:hypothetical protein